MYQTQDRGRGVAGSGSQWKRPWRRSTCATPFVSSHNNKDKAQVVVKAPSPFLAPYLNGGQTHFQWNMPSTPQQETGCQISEVLGPTSRQNLFEFEKLLGGTAIATVQCWISPMLPPSPRITTSSYTPVMLRKHQATAACVWTALATDWLASWPGTAVTRCFGTKTQSLMTKGIKRHVARFTYDGW